MRGELLVVYHYGKVLATGRENRGRKADIIRSAEGSALGEQQGVSPEEWETISWKQSCADTAQWGDDRLRKSGPRHPDFRDKESRLLLWLKNPHKLVCVDSQLAHVDAGANTNTNYVVGLAAA